MFLFSRLLSSVCLAMAVSAAVTGVLPPGSKGPGNGPPQGHHTDPVTDSGKIFKTAGSVNQKGSASGKPNQPVPHTAVTALDGTLTAAGTKGHGSGPQKRSEGLLARSPSDYNQVFSGTGTGPNDRDASIEGTAYLTYTVVNNATYNVNDCLDFCSGISQCVFVNLYYEFNNPGLTTSNLKCAAYADVHTAAEKTNFGGQQLAPPPAGTTYIQQSSGYAAKTLVEPTAPDGYELVFGPTNGANNAPGYMGFAFLDRYDVAACAQQCNTRGADGNGGACQYFNIWRAVVNGSPTTYTCSMYYLPTDASTATNTGQGSLQVTYSRGYKRKNFVVDGGFEEYNACGSFCWTTSYANWVGTSPAPGTDDATIFFFSSYAHTGHGSGLLGSASGSDALSGTLAPAQPLQTVAGKQYQITFFQASAFSGPSGEANAFIDIVWNGQTVSTIHPGYQNWQIYQFTVTAVGNDALAFHGGTAPSWSFIDDITVFQL